MLTFALIVLAILIGTLALDALLPVLRLPALALPDLLQNYVTVFLGIFIEAVPFLLLGSLASGLIAEFVSADDIARFFPRNKVLGSLAGAMLGIAFPVCECGVVPVVRRLYQKGLPISAGIAFLLAAPVINPVVIASTYAAFGLSPIFWGRIVFTIVIAFGVGLVFSVQPNLARIIVPRSLMPVMGGMDMDTDARLKTQDDHRPPSTSFAVRLRNHLAWPPMSSLTWVAISSSARLSLQRCKPLSRKARWLASGAGRSHRSLRCRCWRLCCRYAARSMRFWPCRFVNTFTTGAVIAFLVFGPMIDIKSTLMFWSVFRPRIVIYIVLLTFLSALLVGVFVNLNIGW